MEAQFRKYLRGLLHKSGVWTATVEHNRGATVGVPDLLVHCRDALIPAELKVAEWAPGTEILHSSRIRPAQIRLLDEALTAGIRARLVLGTSVGRAWNAWMLRDVRAARLREWRAGFPTSDLVPLVMAEELLIMPDRW